MIFRFFNFYMSRGQGVQITIIIITTITTITVISPRGAKIRKSSNDGKAPQAREFRRPKHECCGNKGRIPPGGRKQGPDPPRSRETKDRSTPDKDLGVIYQNKRALWASKELSRHDIAVNCYGCLPCANAQEKPEYERLVLYS